MYINFTFIAYMCAVCSGIISVAMLISVFAMKVTVRTGQLRKFIFFAISSFLFVVLYFIFYYREKVLGLFELVLPFRIADYLIEGLLLFSMILLINSLGDPLNQIKHNKIIVKISGVVCIIWFISGSVMTAVFMNSYYYISDPAALSIFPVMEIILIGILIALILYSCITNMRMALLSLTGKYIAVISILLTLLLITQTIVNFNLYHGQYDMSAWEHETPDLTGTIFTLINIATIYFILKTDFTPIYISGKTYTENPSLDTDEPGTDFLLDLTAEKHKLTNREREIIELVYEGYSNPDIAKHLYISNNTVKRHMKHIFEKLDVSTRIEMIHLINSQKIPL